MRPTLRNKTQSQRRFRQFFPGHLLSIRVVQKLCGKGTQLSPFGQTPKIPASQRLTQRKIAEPADRAPTACLFRALCSKNLRDSAAPHPRF
jgi:hypothetical protein